MWKKVHYLKRGRIVTYRRWEDDPEPPMPPPPPPPPATSLPKLEAFVSAALRVYRLEDRTGPSDNYNFTSGELLGVVGKRMLAIVRIARMLGIAVATELERAGLRDRSHRLVLR